MCEQGYANTTLERIRICITGVFDKAKYKKVLVSNPAKVVKPIRGETKPKRELTDKEIYWFFSGLEESKPNEYLFFDLLLKTGIRCGEAIALRWCDIVDFSEIIINSTYVKYKNKEGETIISTQSPKSLKSKRNIPITDIKLIEGLKRRKDDIVFIHNQFNMEFEEDSFIFYNITDPIKDERYYSYTIQSTINYLKKKYNISIEHFSCHNFRHTFVTRAIRNKVPLETIKQLLGHSDYNMISRVYAHCSQEDKMKAIKTINQSYHSVNYKS